MLFDLHAFERSDYYRASLYLYNDETDIDTLADALADAGDFFAF